MEQGGAGADPGRVRPGAADAGEPGVQERYAPRSVCFGCGPANPGGLHLRSYERDGELVAEWRAQPRYEAWPGTLNGGIVGTLLDCHSNWAGALALMRAAGSDAVPATVTARYEVALLRPASTAGPITLRARVAELAPDRATVESTLEAGGERCATFRGTFVAVRPGHPAYHRWE
jgi:acyl-coenzyme A thioesterase PaaI-like protein